MAIEINDLSVQFNNGTVALDHITLDINNGMFGLLGENGAGKTTLMRVLTTIIKPTDGSVILNGIKIRNENYEEVQRKIGYLPQELNLYPNLTVRETLEYMGGLGGISKDECRKQIDYYLEKTSLVEHQKKKNRQLSGGMKRRVGLIQALLHNPEVLIVDEPTTGLDPEERIRIRNLLVEFSRNRTVLFSTHVLEDLAATCNNLAIIKKGELIYHGSKSELLHRAKDCVWKCKVADDNEFMALKEKYIISSKMYQEGYIEARVITEAGAKVDGVLTESTLEDAYIYLMNQGR